ncbi:MAG TPA: hypothetical protein VGC42_05685 [Kofleriaceae bacterium]
MTDPGPHPPAARAPVLPATVDLWLRYLAPLTALSATALAPVIALALLARRPTEPAEADAARAIGWGLVALAWVGQLMLVGAAAAIARARPSQLGALRLGLRALGRAIVPTAAAVAAVLLGGLALALPGVALLALTALAGASPLRGAAAVADSIAIARRSLVAVALAAAALVALDAGTVLAVKLAVLEPLAKPPRPVQLAQLPRFLHLIALVLVAGSPLPAAALAVIRARDAA